jgi:NADH-quinone oxidoreductase subunit B
MLIHAILQLNKAISAEGLGVDRAKAAKAAEEAAMSVLPPGELRGLLV